jgi:hypothetical protein
MTGVSRVGLKNHFGLENSQLVEGLNVYLLCSGKGLLLLSCDALCWGKTLLSGSVLYYFGLWLRREMGRDIVKGSDMARFRFDNKGFKATSSGGRDGGRWRSCVEVTHDLVRLSFGIWRDPGCIVRYVKIIVL